MSDLIDFLLARIADEESLARDAASEGNPPRTGWQLWTNKVSTTPGGERLGPRGTVEAHPNRVLAECEAKRRIVKMHEVNSEIEQYGIAKGTTLYWCSECDRDLEYGHVAGKQQGCDTLRILAAVYADHPDYREEWRP